MRGRLAALINWAARRIWGEVTWEASLAKPVKKVDWLVGGLTGMPGAAGMGLLRMAAVTSLGKSTKTGPGRPEVAISKASLMRRGRSAMSLTMTFHFVQAREIPTTSASW